MTILDVIQTLTSILTSAFGQGWGSTVVLMSRHFKKRSERLRLSIRPSYQALLL